MQWSLLQGNSGYNSCHCVNCIVISYQSIYWSIIANTCPITMPPVDWAFSSFSVITPVSGDTRRCCCSFLSLTINFPIPTTSSELDESFASHRITPYSVYTVGGSWRKEHKHNGVHWMYFCSVVRDFCMYTVFCICTYVHVEEIYSTYCQSCSLHYSTSLNDHSDESNICKYIL